MEEVQVYYQKGKEQKQLDFEQLGFEVAIRGISFFNGKNWDLDEKPKMKKQQQKKAKLGQTPDIEKIKERFGDLIKYGD